MPISPVSSHNGLGYVDASGCLRTRCEWTDECGEDEVCILGWAFGECVGAVSSCSDELFGETCSCIIGAICDAAYCAAIAELPFELSEVTQGPAGYARWVGGCSRDGYPITTLTLGLDEPTCTSQASGPSLEITFPGTLPEFRNQGDQKVFGEEVEAPLVEARFDADGNGLPDDGPVTGGVLRLRGPSTGRYEFVHAGRLVFGQYSEITPCPSSTPCE
ncbi:MAG: hypothetical protein AAGA54_08630 [Myxococcota bacterium]